MTERWEWNEDFDEIQSDFGCIIIAHCDDKARGMLLAAAPELLAACEELVAAIAAARAAEDNWYRSGNDEALGMAFESAAATSVIKENAARAAISKARGEL